MKNYYQILGISPDSSTEDIKKAYRKLAKKFHPDINKSIDANAKFIEINEAYEMLLHHTHLKDKPFEAGSSEYQDLVNKIREEAQRRARMKYEKFQREHEAYRESGLYDLVLILKYLGALILPAIATALIFSPFYIAFKMKEPGAIGYLAFFWIIGGFLWYDIFQRRKNYFDLGKFYYTRKKLKLFFSSGNIKSTEKCFYCKGLNANSHPFKINIIHIKSIRLKNQGPLQHYVSYNRTEEKLLIPRSHKAFLIHSIVSFFKVISILFFVFLVNIDSFPFRVIGGLFLGWIISFLLLLITRTRSKVSYLFSYAIIIKIILWISIMALVSNFQWNPFNIYSTDYLPVTLVVMFFFDSIFEQLLKLPKKNLYSPIFSYYKTYSQYFDKNNYLYLEVPFWTTFYPFMRWLV